MSTQKFLLGVVVVITLIGVIGLWSVLNPLMTVLGLVVGAGVLGFAAWKANKSGDARSFNNIAGLGVLAMWLCMFGPAVAKKAKRATSVPDVAVLHSNGKVVNATDSSKANFYFKHFEVSAEDSLYIVQNGEEPGFNNHALVKTGDVDSSKAPRANEDWKKPASKEAKKLEGKY